MPAVDVGLGRLDDVPRALDERSQRQLAGGLLDVSKVKLEVDLLWKLNLPHWISPTY